MEDYICDQKCKDKNCSHDDVARSTKEVGDLDKYEGVICKETPSHGECEQDTDPNPDRLTIISKKSEPEGSQHVEKVNKECDSQAAIVVSNKLPQPVSRVLTLPTGETSLINTIGQNEPKGSQLQLNTNDGENNIQSPMIQMNTQSLKQMVLLIRMNLCTSQILLWIKINVINMWTRTIVLWIQITMSRRKILM